MATFHNADWAGDLAGVGAANATQDASKRGLLQRFVEAVMLSRQRSAAREVEAYIARNGGVLTDELERSISRNFGSAAGQHR